MQRMMPKGCRVGFGMLLSLVVGWAIAPIAIAQSSNSPTLNPDPTRRICQPPGANEYLLLIVSQTEANQAKVRQLLPPNTSIVGCQYLNDMVTRVGGFANVEVANAWAQYVSDTTGLPAFVARPAEVATTSPNQLSYNPKPLESGFAVLVDYFNRPELAVQVQQLLGKQVGLVSYGRRPYLLADYTADQAAANSTLKTLSDRGYRVIVVDSRQVTLLRSTVSVR